jgi:hypothetical protein
VLAHTHAGGATRVCEVWTKLSMRERSARERLGESAQEPPGVAEESALALGAAVERERKRLGGRET